jgi:uncharacterized damage-inducible protein DinB
MREEERQAILASLEKGSAELRAALEGVTEEQAARVPGAGKWSILQCVEHVAAAEDHLFSLITASKHSDTPLINEQREVLIATFGANRNNKRESPAAALPRSRFATLHEAVQGFRANRGRTIQFVYENQEDLRSKITTHPLMGTVNCYEVLLLMAVHPARHAQQIVEIKAALAG